MTTTTTFKLTGTELISHVEDNLRANVSRTELIINAGYSRISEGIVRANYVEFYEHLLAAKMEANPELYSTPENETESYDDLKEESRELYDHLSETIGEKWEHSEQMEFMNALAEDLGIETKEQFEDSFYSMSEHSWNSEAEFAEEFCTETEPNLRDSLAYHAINWQRVWDHQLRYDFNTLEFDGSTYFFRNI